MIALFWFMATITCCSLAAISWLLPSAHPYMPVGFVVLTALCYDAFWRNKP